jgi:hypothetical protein
LSLLQTTPKSGARFAGRPLSSI